MNLVYVLVPFFKIDSRDHIQREARQQLGIFTQQDGKNIIVHQISRNQYAVKISNFDLHFLEINRLLENYNGTKKKIDILESIVKNYEYQTHANQEYQNENVQSLMKKVKKYRQVKEENKKLKKLLQVQLQNTQKVRQETQKTMKVLRHQFDALVIEIGRKQKNSLHSAHQCHSNPPQLQRKQYQSKQKGTLSGEGKHANIR